jgi:putative aldouronate transport system substrate-binding protein
MKPLVRSRFVLPGIVLLASLSWQAPACWAEGSKEATQAAAPRKPATTAEAVTKLTGTPAEKLALPVSKDKVTISYFAMPELYVVSKMKGYAEMEVFQELEKRTNVAIKWREESYTDPKAKMNLMFSTGEVEDVIWDAHQHAAGGVKKVMDDGLVLPLNWYIDKFAPNLKKLLMENRQLLKEVSLDDGRIYMFPEIRLDPWTRANSGPVLRKDWLDKLGLKPPTTIDEWYIVLKAFREKDPNGNGKQDEIPFVSLPFTSDSWSILPFAGAFGFVYSTNFLYLDGDTVKFAAFHPNYRAFVATLAKWYAEGLLDPEFASTDTKMMDAKMTGDRGGAYYGALSGGLGKYLGARKPGSSYDLVPVGLPKAADGKMYTNVGAYRALVPHGAVIGKNNKYIVETTKWMDYHYTDEGANLLNYGVEGRAHTVKDGKRIFTDLVMKNPNGLTLEEAAAKYAGGTIVQMPGFDLSPVNVQIKNAFPQQAQASAIWATFDTSKILPTVFMPPDKTREAAAIMTEVKTYMLEMTNKFIMGKEPLENFDKFIQTLKSLKTEKMVEYYNEAYQQWLKD